MRYLKNAIQEIMSVLLLVSVAVHGQQTLTQTVRGSVVDQDTKLPIMGALIELRHDTQLSTAESDSTGEFRFEHIPTGSVQIRVSYPNYGTLSLNNIGVSTGKEVVLGISLQENAVQLEAISIVAGKNKGEVLNDMSLVSSRSISTEETKRYAGGFNDPALILSNFAGVTNSQDGNNDIIVRGNSPKYVQFRLEGTEITNPNHFGDQNGVRGGVNALNNNILATSDFHSGAFTPEFGDALSGVYDIKIREGNNQKAEHIFGLGILGTDVTTEGPFKKGHKGSYLANYRYSTLSLLDNLGVVDVGGVPKFQDGAFKVVLPTKHLGKFSVFGLGGLSNIYLKDLKASTLPTAQNTTLDKDLSQDFKKGAYLANMGLNHQINLGDKSVLLSTVSFAGNGVDDDVFEKKTYHFYNDQNSWVKDSVGSPYLINKSRLDKATYRAGISFAHKWSAKTKILCGSKYALSTFQFKQSVLQNHKNWFDVVDFSAQMGTWRNYFSIKQRLGSSLTMVGGIHSMYVFLNNKGTIEPRLSLKWQFSPNNTLSAGYGKHSTMESVHNYFARITDSSGKVWEPNKNLGLLKADHFVVGYEIRLTDHLLAKLEAYYQHLYNLPVENLDTSYYATLNEGVNYRYTALTNQGKGQNYGIELTLERFFHKNFYYMFNASVFNSQYQSLEKTTRNTLYNSQYVLNLIAGKEFDGLGKKKNKMIAINARIFWGGGKRYIPLLRDSTGQVSVDVAKNQFWNYQKAYEPQFEPIYSITASISYKVNRKKTSHEIYLNLDNLSNHKGKLTEYYDASQPGKVGYNRQFGFYPQLMYKVYF